ncbi:hypothetical protein K470DRAFT_259751 [Piedraia hortae CBS 480.64]|uniref:Uncharacterized protein n=1 Tax=Piedraia hortae CBS 480.64 TaxID=1314780 RepID=A0A6A7BTC4_9PEZI|nr:hypothetical protein K470DRAFT_259751 [Piedraia hortae CBS 480.64]
MSYVSRKNCFQLYHWMILYHCHCAQGWVHLLPYGAPSLKPRQNHTPFRTYITHHNATQTRNETNNFVI